MEQKGEVFCPHFFLADTLFRETFETGTDLFGQITARGHVRTHGRQYSHDAPALLATTAGVDSVPVLVPGMTGDLMALQFRISLHESLLDEDFGQGSQHGKLTDIPTFAMKIAAQGVVKIAALVV